MVACLSARGGLFPKERDDVARQLLVELLVGRVQQQVDEVEAGHEGRRQLQVGHHAHARIVARAHGVGGSQHAGAGIELRDDTCLGDRHRLLLHDLVQLHTRTRGAAVTACFWLHPPVSHWEPFPFESRGPGEREEARTMLRVASVILSNSSMQQTPLSLSTSAPLSKTISLVSGSCGSPRP